MQYCDTDLRSRRDTAMTLRHLPAWHPDRFAQRYANLKIRQRVIAAIRQHFDALGFDAVETPILQTAPGCEVHLHAFRTELIAPDHQSTFEKWLHTSPEFAMKKLLVAGATAIYQICPVFRNAEGSHRHSAEFTMIEWYRTAHTYHTIMADCVDILRLAARAGGVSTLTYQGKHCDPFQEPEYLSVDDAFRRYADIPLSALLDNRDGLVSAAAHAGARVLETDSWDDVFFAVMHELIEPQLGIGRPCFLYEYPAHMAVLSRKKPDDPRWAERFELYINGLELANAFSELTDPTEQRTRFAADMAEKEHLYGHRWPIDDDFLAALDHGMPDCAGIALGVDRLIMLVTAAAHIDDVRWLPL